MIDLNKKYKTRDGLKVELLGFSKDEVYPLMGSIEIDGKWYNKTWTKEGKIFIGENFATDLVEIPKDKRVELDGTNKAFIYQDGSMNISEGELIVASISRDSMKRLMQAYKEMME